MAHKSVRLSIKNDRIEALERRTGLVEKILNDSIQALTAEIKGLKENELEHIYGEMTALKKCQEGITEFQAEMKGSIKTLKWIMGIVLGLLPVLVKILDMVIK